MTSPTGPLLHLCTEAEWSRAQTLGHVDAPSLTEVGFIHLSAPYQVHLPANRLFAARTDLLALHVDPALVHAMPKPAAAQARADVGDALADRKSVV